MVMMASENDNFNLPMDSFIKKSFQSCIFNLFHYRNCMWSIFLADYAYAEKSQNKIIRNKGYIWQKWLRTTGLNNYHKNSSEKMEVNILRYTKAHLRRSTNKRSKMKRKKPLKSMRLPS